MCKNVSEFPQKNGFFFIDKLFAFEEYKTFDPIVRGLAINASVDNNINKTSKIFLIGVSIDI